MADKKYLDYAGLQTLVQNIKNYCDDIAHVVLKGSVAGVADLPSLVLATTKEGEMYTIQNDDSTTADFVEGAGKHIEANSEVAVTVVSGVKKWFVLGPIFDVSDRLQFGTTMPATDLTNGRTFLYMGETTYTYSAVTPVGDENPQALGWYVEDGSGGYELTTDTTVQSGTTYYTRAEEYVKGVIYKYSTADSAWIAQSSGDTYVAITTAEINALFN